jgi:hypothetical protein
VPGGTVTANNESPPLTRSARDDSVRISSFARVSTGWTLALASNSPQISHPACLFRIFASGAHTTLTNAP